MRWPQRVLDTRRNLGIDSACDQAIALESPERDRQHALADSVHLLAQLVEAQRSRIAEDVDDVHRPRVAHAGEHVSRVTVRGCVLELRRSLSPIHRHELLQFSSGTFWFLLSAAWRPR